MQWSRFGLVLGLSLSLAACGAAAPGTGSATPPATGGQGGGGQTGSALPEKMVGGWLYGTLSSIEYYDPGSNKWMDSSGASEIVKYQANGRYERTRLLSLRTYNCESKLFIYEKGVVKLQGDKLTYQPSEGVNKGYTCSPSNSWNTNKINSETWTLAFETDSGGKDVMVLSDGEAVAHYGRYNP